MLGNKQIFGSALFSVGEHVQLRPGGSIRKLAGGANPELSTQLFGYNSEGRLTQREGKQQGGLRTRCPTRLWEDNEHAGHQRDFALVVAGLTSDEVNPFFSTMKSMKDRKGKKAE